MADEDIPMTKSKPTTLIVVVGAVVLLGGVALFTLTGKKSKKEKAAQEARAAVEAMEPGDNMTAAERKRHLEITRKSLGKFQAKKEAEEAAKKAAEAEKKAAAEAEASKVAAAPKAGGTPAKRPVTKAAGKKTSGDLDSLGKGILDGLK